MQFPALCCPNDTSSRPPPRTPEDANRYPRGVGNDCGTPPLGATKVVVAVRARARDPERCGLGGHTDPEKPTPNYGLRGVRKIQARPVPAHNRFLPPPRQILRPRLWRLPILH